jgi:hypothetical protein
MPPIVRIATTALLLALSCGPRLAQADDGPRASYATPEDLAPEGLPHELEISMGAQVTHVLQRPAPDPLNGLGNIAAFALKNRVLVGTTLAYSGGLDAYVGGSDTGAAYGATLYPVGLGVRGGPGTFVALSGGVGVDRVVGSVPAGALFPADLSLGFPLGPLRPILWARATWVADAPERRHGSPSISAVDELETGLAIRFGKQQRYWLDLNAGGGPSIGAFYREFMGARAIGLLVSLDLSAGK